MGLLDRWLKKDKEKKLKKAASAKADKSASPSAEKEAVKVKAEAQEGGGVKATGKIKGDLSSRILTRPLVTEKSASMESGGKYIFLVARDAGKGSIAAAVEESYGVKPVSVRTINMEGKTVRHGKTFGRRSGFKKAIVTLPKGKTISVHEGV